MRVWAIVIHNYFFNQRPDKHAKLFRRQTVQADTAPHAAKLVYGGRCAVRFSLKVCGFGQQPGALLLQVLNPLDRVRAVQAVFDGLIQAVYFFLDTGRLLLHILGLVGRAVPLPHTVQHCQAQPFHCCRVQHNVLDIIQHRAFQLVGRHGTHMLSGTVQAFLGGADIVAVFDRHISVALVSPNFAAHCAAAPAAVHKPRQQVEHLCTRLSALVAPLFHLGLCPAEVLRIYDSRHTVFHIDPLRPWLQTPPADMPVRVGRRQFVPYVHAGVFLVAQDFIDAVFAERPTTTGRVAAAVQLVDDRRIPGVLQVHPKDNPHRLGFPRLDDELSGGLVHRVTQRRRAASVAGVYGVFAQALHYFLGQVGTVPLVDGLCDIAHKLPLRAVVKMLGCRQHPNAMPAQLDFHQCLALRVAEEAVQLVDDDILRAAGRRVLDHLHELRPFPIPAAVAVVFIDFDQFVPAGSSIGNDGPLLRLDAFFALFACRLAAISISQRRVKAVSLHCHKKYTSVWV